MTPRMKIGFTLPTYTWPDLDQAMGRRIVKDMARRAEALGYDSITVWDHLLDAPGLYGGSWLDPLTVLSCVAGATDAIPIGTHILVLPLRHPVLLAKELGTLSCISEGRLFMGVGPGWNEPEFTAMGISMRERGRRTDESLDALSRLLREEKVSFQGRFWQFDDVTIVPRPERPITVWVAGGSRVPDPMSPDKPFMVRSVMDRIARHADVFTVRASGKHEWVARDIAAVREHLRTAGRDPATLGIAHVQAGYIVDTDDREAALARQRRPMQAMMGQNRSWEHLQDCYLLGSVDDIVAKLRALEAAGVEHVTIHPASAEMEQLELWMDRVIEPHFRD
ncbi:MAG: LLM class flavin-dependent oxidoreductase [Ectothiorhodospiraceae bacterium]|nr:LLM class flavin-dependent oxidoreductase [Chromatiales bacterium]MCP5153337.1 LLM class flavin-dependent oxidoreductase [Ectothiorhodospiraceae bacterium]